MKAIYKAGPVATNSNGKSVELTFQPFDLNDKEKGKILARAKMGIVLDTQAKDFITANKSGFSGNSFTPKSDVLRLESADFEFSEGDLVELSLKVISDEPQSKKGKK